MDAAGQSLHGLSSPDGVDTWAVPEAEKNLLLCNLWQSWYPRAPEQQIWETVKKKLFHQDLFVFVCSELFGLDSNDPTVSTQKLPERHATLRCD